MEDDNVSINSNQSMHFIIPPGLQKTDRGIKLFCNGYVRVLKFCAANIDMSPRAQKPHTADLQILHYILHYILHTLGFNQFFISSYIFANCVRSRIRIHVFMGLDPENINRIHKPVYSFPAFYILLLHFFPLTPP